LSESGKPKFSTTVSRKIVQDPCKSESAVLS
jgi:hypothetical protein